MTDFLNRLIKRSNGQAAVLRPMARSSYGALPLINESASEFEETVTFDGVDPNTATDGRTISSTPRSIATVTDAGTSPTIANPEVSSLLVKSPVANPMIEQRPGQRAGRQAASKSVAVKAAPSSERTAGGKASGSAKGAASRTKAADAAPAIAQNLSHVGNISIQRKPIANGTMEPAAASPLRNEQGANTVSRGNEMTGHQRTSADAASPIPQVKSRLSGDSVQRKAVGATLVPKAIVSRQQNALAQAEGRAIATPHSNVSRRASISDNESMKRLVATSDTASVTTQRDFHLVDDNRIEARRNATSFESMQNAVEIQAVKRVPHHESDLSERKLSQDMVIRGREESAESSLRQNTTREQSTAEKVQHAPDRSLGRTAERVAFESESTPSTNIRVTIGRVEIRAVQQPERQAARPTSVPRKPAVSLDAYLKRRNEEKR